MQAAVMSDMEKIKLARLPALNIPMRASDELTANPSGTEASNSPAGRTKPPKGIQFRLISAPQNDPSRANRGGKPIPNSLIPT
jgi:hypothetical protein